MNVQEQCSDLAQSVRLCGEVSTSRGVVTRTQVLSHPRIVTRVQFYCTLLYSLEPWKHLNFRRDHLTSTLSNLIASRGQPRAAGASQLCCTRAVVRERRGSSQHDARVLQQLARSSTPSCHPCALQHPARCTLHDMANHAKHAGKQLCRFTNQAVPPSAAAGTRGTKIQHSC